jgi:hypothetical protein
MKQNKLNKYFLKNFSLYVLLFYIMFFLVSCVVPEENVPNDDYRKGTNGIVVNFMSGILGDKVYTNQDLEVVAEIRNLGAFNEPKGKIYLYGFDASFIPFDSRSSDSSGQLNYVEKDIPKVMGIGPFLKTGGYDKVSFIALKDSIKIPSKNYNLVFTLNTCFNYKTVLSPTVCILPDSSIMGSSTVCRPSTITLSSQAAPVAVTKVESQIIGTNNIFYITIENVGNGRVISNNQTSYNKCPFNLNHEDYDLVDYKVLIENLPEAECNPKGKVKLYNNKARLECRFSTVDNNVLLVSSSYTTPLQIELDYNYVISTNKKVEIISTNI